MLINGFDLSTAIALAMLISSAINFAVLSPINKQIKELSIAIISLRNEIEQSKDDRRHIDVRLAKVEESARSAHRRIDDIGRE